MNIEKTWLWGGAGGLFGLLLGIAIAGDGRESREAEIRSQAEIKEFLASVSEAVGGIRESLTDLGGKVAAIETSVGQVGAQEAGLQALQQRLDKVGTDLQGAVAEIGGAVSEVGSTVTQSLSERVDGLRETLAGVTARALGSGGGEATPAEPAAPAGGTPAKAGAGEAVPMGASVAFGEGAARVFLSGVDPAAGTARVAINGPVPSVVSLGQPVEAGACSVTLTGFTPEGGATFDTDCNGETTTAEAAAGDVASGEHTGNGKPVAIGAAEALVEGKLRVFLSAVDAEAGTARVAVNGPTAVGLSLGTPVEAGGCTVTLTEIGDGQATIDGAC